MPSPRVPVTCEASSLGSAATSMPDERSAMRMLGTLGRRAASSLMSLARRSATPTGEEIVDALAECIAGRLTATSATTTATRIAAALRKDRPTQVLLRSPAQYADGQNARTAAKVRALRVAR